MPVNSSRAGWYHAAQWSVERYGDWRKVGGPLSWKAIDPVKAKNAKQSQFPDNDGHRHFADVLAWSDTAPGWTRRGRTGGINFCGCAPLGQVDRRT